MAIKDEIEGMLLHQLLDLLCLFLCSAPSIGRKSKRQKQCLAASKRKWNKPPSKTSNVAHEIYLTYKL